MTEFLTSTPISLLAGSVGILGGIAGYLKTHQWWSLVFAAVSAVRLVQFLAGQS